VAPTETESVIDGVDYVHTNRMAEQVTKEWDAVIISRWHDLLQHGWNTKCLLIWLHDMPQKDMPALKAHKVVVLSQFHASAYGFPAESFEVIGDGVDLSLFEGTDLTRNENVLVWTSNPDRGVALAAKIFQDQLRPRWPDLEFHIFGRSSVYGWPSDMEGPYLPRDEHMENVFLHDPLTKAGLAKMLKEAWAWFYPTYWPETYCIAALEAQAAGTPIVCSRYGALMETVLGGIPTYDFVNAISQLRNKNRWKKLSEVGVEYAANADWDERAKQWEAVINNVRSN